jgi:hypothetical protein
MKKLQANSKKFGEDLENNNPDSYPSNNANNMLASTNTKLFEINQFTFN